MYISNPFVFGIGVGVAASVIVVLSAIIAISIYFANRK